LTAPRIRVPVPAETGGEDRLVGSVTFRHAAYLALTVAGVAVMLLDGGSIARVVVGALLAVVGLVGALCRPYEEPIDRLAFAAHAYHTPRRAQTVDQTLDEEPEAVPTEDDVTVTPSVPTPTPVMNRRPRVNPVAVRRLAVGIAIVGIAAVAAVRVLDRPAPVAPEQRVVVVPVPVNPPDPWQEVDRAFDEWLRSFG
jgi:hypothetical protein